MASGKFAEENDLEISVAPDDLRKLVLYTLENCVVKHGLGGYTTKDFDKTLGWIISPGIDFPSSLDLPAYITFFTAMVWHTEGIDQEEGYDPGAHDPWTTLSINAKILDAEENAPPRSAFRRSLGRRHSYIQVSANVQQESQGSKRAWWENWLHPPKSFLISASDRTSTCEAKSTYNLTAREKADCRHLMSV